MADEDKDKSAKGIVSEAKERFKRAEEAYKSSRRQAIDDTRFAFGDSENCYQWHQDALESRKSDHRVCLTINLTAQHCGQVINNIRQSRPSCRVMPVDDYADKKTAEILAGLIRNIQSASSADDAHDLAAEHSIYGGEGYWRILTEFESERSHDQVIKVKPIANPNLVYIDPDATELDKSDAKWGFIFDDINIETFQREHPDLKDEPKSWESNEDKWVSNETFRRAEYFWCEYIKDKSFLLSDGSCLLESELSEDAVRNDKIISMRGGRKITILKERDTERKQWYWCKLIGGYDKPIDKREWAGKYLPIISIIGKQINIDGEIITKGLVRDLKDPARMVNYAYSEAIQSVAMQNKIPYMAASESIEGYEDEWANANNSNLAYLPFNAYDEQGQPLPRPERQQAAVMPAALIQLLQTSTEEMRGASGMSNANFGIKSEAASGVGIQRLKAQGEISTFHFPDNLARGLRYEAKVLIDLIQQTYDTKRVVRILGLDGKQESATLDPEHPEAYGEADTDEEDIQRIFNPSVGAYDVVIDTGPSFQTQRQEAFAALTELAGRNPALMQVAGDIIMRAADFPQADALAKRLEKTLPPNLQDQKAGGAEQQLAQAQQQSQQMQQHIQQMTQQMQEMQGKLQQSESGQAKVQAEIQARTQLAQQDAEFQAEKIKHEMAAKHEQYMMESQFKREQAELDAHLALEKANTERELKLQLAKMEIESKEEIAELNAYVELQKIGKENTALTADVNNDLKDKEE